MKAIFLFLLLSIVRSFNIVEFLGLTSLMQDLAKLNTDAIEAGPNSSAYLLNPNIKTFLQQFGNRTKFCDYKCKNFFNLPCFLIFDCNIHLRNFILIFLFPFFLLLLTGLCCGKGIWSLSCWMQYVATFTGVRLIVWAIKKRGEKKQNEDRRSQEAKGYPNIKIDGEKNGKKNIRQFQMPKTTERMRVDHD